MTHGQDYRFVTSAETGKDYVSRLLEFETKTPIFEHRCRMMMASHADEFGRHVVAQTMPCNRVSPSMRLSKRYAPELDRTRTDKTLEIARSSDIVTPRRPRI